MRTFEGKLVLWEVATGKQGEFWPIDARTLLAAGSHMDTAPEGVEVKAPPVPPARVGLPQSATVTVPTLSEPSVTAEDFTASTAEAPAPRRARRPKAEG